MVKRLSDSNIWSKDWFLDLTDKQKLLVKFLFDNCDCCGVYEISKRMLRTCFNSEITKKDFEGIKQIRFISDNKIFIEDFIKFQYNTSIPLLNPLNRVHKGILKCLEKHNLLRVSEQLPNCTGVGVGVGIGVGEGVGNSNSKLYGEYSNVHLSKEQYGKLLGICASEELLNELINSFSVNIEVGKERPYTAELENAHYERLRSYYNYRKKHPEKFREESSGKTTAQILEEIRLEREGKNENMGIS